MIIFSGYDTYRVAKDILCLNVNFKEHNPKWKKVFFLSYYFLNIFII